MAIEPYRRVLALPGMRALLLVGLIARVPLTGTGITLTLHVVGDLRLGFLQAGLVGAVSMGGSALGSPIAGRFVDRSGLRPVLAATTAAQAAFWCAAPHLPYQALLAGSLVAGVLSQPVFGAIRQCVAALVPQADHRTGFALDSMAVEVSYMVGPALAVASVTAFGAPATMYGVAAGLVGAGLGLFLLNPPTRTEAESAEREAVPRRQWLRPGLIMLLGLAAGLTFVLTATELSLVATLRLDGATEWTGLVVALWGGYSMIGGFVYGGLSRGLSPLLLIGGLGAATMPVGLAHGGWWWLCLAVVPCGLLCAPALSSTVDAVNRRVPASARGEAMGLHGTALTMGVAAAGPLAGAVVDGYGPGWAFAASGALVALLALAATPFRRVLSPPAVPGPVVAGGDLAGGDLAGGGTAGGDATRGETAAVGGAVLADSARS
ncbi:MFS transporter [Microbispora sp. RL4-1S]|uniref:MFS transporter n=2 Tax=Microbispora oryzae TaxID=2806554 RepID=A0A941AG55_9ACTN|nr:MFS transporter [Microbispora oryzae]